MTLKALHEVEQLLIKYLKDNDPEDFGCACTPTHTCGPCAERNRQILLQKALKLAHNALENGKALDWKEAVVNELVVAHIYTSEHDTDPRKAVQDAITWNCEVSLDPKVSSDAQALIDQGYSKAITLVKDLVASLEKPEEIDFSDTVVVIPEDLT